MEPLHITSRDNPLLQKLRRLSADGSAYRKAAELWLEGDHLCRAALERGHAVLQAVVSESAWQLPQIAQLMRRAPRVVVVPDNLFKAVSGLEAPTGCGFLLPWQPQAGLLEAVPTMVLDRLQDAGNVGSLLRSAAALGVQQVIALKGTTALWAPKVLRAGMGAHFGLHLVESATPESLDALRVPLVGTSSHTDLELDKAALPEPCAWVFGHEGQGVAEALQQQCSLMVRIPQPGGEESLNVAAAGAVCLYESLRQRRAAGRAQ